MQPIDKESSPCPLNSKIVNLLPKQLLVSRSQTPPCERVWLRETKQLQPPCNFSAWVALLGQQCHLHHRSPYRLLLHNSDYSQALRLTRVRVWVRCMYGTILRVWFPGCPLFRGNFVLKSAVGSLDLVRCPESRSVRFSEVV